MLRLHGPISKQNLHSGCMDLFRSPFHAQIAQTYQDHCFVLRLHKPILLWEISTQQRGLDMKSDSEGVNNRNPHRVLQVYR